ncbi:uncharacterized protein [Panulirus ornatus]|uniref:uncharacterized protein n=1 Tax=Panulirus ornatus TaxID=150431 RepID=UPI003A8B4B05
MSPVPEPTQGDRVGPDDGEEELNPPTGFVVGPVSSSDDELEPSDSNDPFTTGYQPLSQENDVDEDEEIEVDYSSLSGLMSSLTNHGPNVVSDEEGSSEDARHEERAGERDAACALTGLSIQTTSLVQESARQSHDEVLHERAAVWNSSPAPDRLVLDGNKVEEIKSVMASFTLPQSAVPVWAQNLSEDEWKDQIACIVSGRTSH